jgi:putative hydrolase of HD superfamily
MNEQNTPERLADFLYEIGTMRKILRIHRQTLLSDDVSDNIATHSYRVTMIGWLLAEMEGADKYKTVMMCLLHDAGEIRTNDHNWVHKRYSKTYDDEVLKDQLGSLPFQELFDLGAEYEARESREAVIAKDADMIDQILLLREYEWQGNKEAAIWLRGKSGSDPSRHLTACNTASGRELATAILERDPSDWWNEIWTNVNRKD